MRWIAAALVCPMLASSKAHAEPGGDPSDASYYVDGGAIPLLWLPALTSLAMDRWAPPRSTPLYFPSSEGGARRATWEVPPWTLDLAAAGAGLAIGLGNDDARWYHVKGLAQAMATSSLAVSTLKMLVGRHRPDWTIESTARHDNRSFPSGHTSNAFVIATYVALYLRGRVFDDKSSALLQGVAYGGLFLGASMVASERVYHERHHLSDVMAGAVIGSVTSYLMYRYQDHRFLHDRGEGSLRLTPSVSRNAAMLGFGGVF